jgi:hypothetical protein
MKIQSSDLIIRFDVNDNKVLLLIPKSPEDTGTLKKFFEVSVPAEVTASEFAGEIGAVVASFLHASTVIISKPVMQSSPTRMVVALKELNLRMRGY